MRLVGPGPDRRVARPDSVDDFDGLECGHRRNSEDESVELSRLLEVRRMSRAANRGVPRPGDLLCEAITDREDVGLIELAGHYESRNAQPADPSREIVDEQLLSASSATGNWSSKDGAASARRARGLPD